MEDPPASPPASVGVYPSSLYGRSLSGSVHFCVSGTLRRCMGDRLRLVEIGFPRAETLRRCMGDLLRQDKTRYHCGPSSLYGRSPLHATHFRGSGIASSLWEIFLRRDKTRF
jgi:hypothetical protein